MRITASILSAGLLAWSAPAVAVAQDAPVAATPATGLAAESDVVAFRRLRAEGIAAAGADDLVTAGARLAAADTRIPNHPGLILMRARVAAGAGDPATALAQVARYARAGLVFNLARDPALSALADQPGYAAVAAAVEANRAAVGADRLSVLASIEGRGLVESLVRDAPRQRWLVSLVRDRTIVALDDAGGVSSFLAADASIGGVLGLALDPEAGVLWAAASPLPPSTQGLAPDAPRLVPVLLKIDAASGSVLARYPAPDDGIERALGDVSRAADGTIYVADGIAGDLFQLRPGDAALTPLLPGGTLGSPQGMVVTPDGAALIVVDYSSGLWRIDRSSGAATRLAVPADASLIGVDGLITDGRALYGLQNGVAPQRVLKLVPDAGWTRIVAVEVLAANLPALDEPTTGLVENGELVFVSRSQWSDFDGEGALRTASPAPALIARLRID